MELRKHYVATSYVYDRVADRFLFIFHKNLKKWLPPGGHLLAGEEPHRGALRELLEETGLEGRVLDLRQTPDVSTPTVAQLPTPFCVLAEPIPASPKDDEHIHLDFIYIVEVDPSAALVVCEEEVTQAMWVTGAQIADLDTFANVRRICQAISIATGWGE